MRRLLLPLILVLSFLGSQAFANSCKSTHLSKPSFAQRTKDLVDLNLLQLQQRSSETKTAEQIQIDNKKLIKEALNSPIGKNFRYLDESVATGMIIKINKNRVAGDDQRFQRKDAEVGYCFGRATCGHIQALRSGFKKEQIKKIWAVGPMLDGNVSWGYHVSLIVRDRQGKWWAIDPSRDEAISLNQWYKAALKMSTDKKLEIFITDPEKFSAYAGKYSRLDMGLDGPRELDYYLGYFQELMKSKP